MISILPSEGLAPSQSAPKQNKLSEPSSKPDEPSFSSLVSRDSTDRSADQNSDAALPAQAERAETAATPKPQQTLTSGEQTDPALLNLDDAAVLQTDSSAQPKSANALTSAAISTDTPASSNAALIEAPAEALATTDASPASENKRAQAAILPGTASAEPLQTAKVQSDSAAQSNAEIVAELDVAAKTATPAAADHGEPKVQATLQNSADHPDDDTLKIVRQQDGAELTGPDVKLSQLASDADLAASVSKSALATATGEARVASVTLSAPDAVLSVAQPASTPTAPSGLTPIAPSIPVAAPSEVNSIILNALKNGAEPREQLIVQLDPPELGRVAIDFKFDAQGLQQITVTSENPEALRRLRELHFELTEALKEHGLSEQNLSFRQQADDQSQSGWQTPESSRAGDLFAAVETPTTPPQSVRSNAGLTHPDRLDLTL